MDNQRTDRTSGVRLNSEQKRAGLAAPRIPLQFLVSPIPRPKPAGMDDFSDSAYFHRLHELLWTFREASVVFLLTNDEREALADFDHAFASLAWHEFDRENHFSHLTDNDLSPLIELGKRLLQFLNARDARRGWLSRIWRKKK
jgi:hypothetical protein